MFKIPMASAMGGIVSAFCDLVAVVVRCCPNPKMGRVTTRRIIAAVQHVSTFWDRTVNSLEGNAMGSDLAAVLVAYDSVALLVQGAAPRPAFVNCAFNVIPKEAIGERNEASAVATRFRAEGATLPARWFETALLTEFHAPNHITNG